MPAVPTLFLRHMAIAAALVGLHLPATAFAEAKANATTKDAAMSDKSAPAATLSVPPGQGRLPLPTREDLTPEEQAFYDNNPTAKTNLSRLLTLAPTLAPHFRAFNVAMATAIEVPPIDRELACIATLTLERGTWEIAQHREVARMMGIGDEKFAAVEQERYGDPMFTEREKAVLAFTRQVVKSVRVDDGTFNALARFYSPRQLVELTWVIGNYMSLARVSEMAEIPVDSAIGASFWKDR